MNLSLLIENQYFGTVNYYQTLFQYSNIEIEQYEFFQKMSFRNRCIIPGANGLINLTVPIENGRNQKTLMRDIKIAYRDNWVLQHCRSLEASYNRAPFFEYYRDELFALLEKRPVFLMELNESLLFWTLKKFRVQLNISKTDLYRAETEPGIVDARNTILPKNFQSEDMIGKAPVNYLQVFQDRIGFMPNMCILDLLFCVGPSGANLLKSNENQF